MGKPASADSGCLLAFRFFANFLDFRTIHSKGQVWRYSCVFRHYPVFHCLQAMQFFTATIRLIIRMAQENGVSDYIEWQPASDNARLKDYDGQEVIMSLKGGRGDSHSAESIGGATTSSNLCDSARFLLCQVGSIFLIYFFKTNF